MASRNNAFPTSNQSSPMQSKVRNRHLSPLIVKHISGFVDTTGPSQVYKYVDYIEDEMDKKAKKNIVRNKKKAETDIVSFMSKLNLPAVQLADAGNDLQENQALEYSDQSAPADLTNNTTQAPRPAQRVNYIQRNKEELIEMQRCQRNSSRRLMELAKPKSYKKHKF